MNWLGILWDSLGLLFLGFAFVLVIVFTLTGRKPAPRSLRDMPVFSRLRDAVGLAVEAGTRLHVSTGWGGVLGLRGLSGVLGLSMLERITRAASASDRPPVATAGESALAILSQDTWRGIHRSTNPEENLLAAQLVGLTPFSYAAGVLPVIYDEQVSATVLAGHFGSEVALLTDAAERQKSLVVAGSDNLPAQAVLYASAGETLIGEELFASGAYLNAGPMHQASLRSQDVIRWLLILVILFGAIARWVGSL